MRSDLMSVDCLVITYSGIRSNIAKSCTFSFGHGVTGEAKASYRGDHDAAARGTKGDVGDDTTR